MRSLQSFAAAVFVLMFSISALPLPGRGVSPNRGGTFSRSLALSLSQNGSEATVSVTGRVQTPEGRPIKGANIVLKDAGTNQVVRTTFSSSFGYYRLPQIETGHSYVLSVTHRRYLFALPAQLIEINEDRAGVDFIGEANED